MCEKYNVIFDLDDTLFPESEFALSGFEAVAEYLSKESTFESDTIYRLLQEDFDNSVRGDNFDQLLNKTEIDASIDKLVEVYRTHSPDIELLPEAEICLTQLSDRSLQLITNGTATKQRNKIKALGISDIFDNIYISGEFGTNSAKPSTHLFEKCLEDGNKESERTVYIADNPVKDFIAPNHLGMRSIWINREWGEYADLEPTTDREQPTVSVSDLTAVPDILTQWEIDT
jgi:putative hydrolase of the HAD superfamily